MKSKYLLGATTLLSAATTMLAPEAHAMVSGSFTRNIGSGDISAKYQQYGGATLIATTQVGVGSYNDIWVDTKVFNKSSTLVHVSALAQSTQVSPELYYETAHAYTYVDGKIVSPGAYTCAKWDTCSDATTGFEQTLWNEKKSFGVLPGVTLTVTGQLNTNAALTAAARSYAGPSSLGAGNHRARTSNSIDASLTLNAKLRGELDVIVASVGVYGKVKILALGTAQESRANADRIVGGSNTFSYSSWADQSFSTGSGELGIDGSVCLPCIVSPLVPIPIFTSFKQKITSWGNAYSRTGMLWDQAI